jgi:hypothetical protein
MRALALLGPAILAACGGVSYRLKQDAPTPRTVAVLPLSGPADPGVRELCRDLLIARLQGRGFTVLDKGYADRVLSEAGWLGDPIAFDATRVPAALACRRLDVDAVLIGTGVCESGFNIYILRRRAFGGELRLVTMDGATWWQTDHSASATGGFLLKSGQVVEEFRAQGGHGTSMQTLALVDAFIDEAAGTLPERAAAGGTVDLAIGPVTASRRPGPRPGLETVVVTAEARPGACMWFDLWSETQPGPTGVPMLRIGDRFTGMRDVPAEQPVPRVRIRCRGPFGAEAGREVTVQ